MKFDILTIFPRILDSYINESIIGRARTRGLVEVNFRDTREYTSDKHRTVDDTPYGGGPGMILKIEPVYRCLENVIGAEILAKRVKEKLKTQPRKLSGSKLKTTRPTSPGRSHGGRASQNLKLLLLSPQGVQLTQQKAKELSRYDRLVLICGRYEGVDARVLNLIDEEISIGPYVLSGGELPAMVVVEAVTRLLPGVLGSADSLCIETHTPLFSHEGAKNGLREVNFAISKHAVEYPQYTRPEIFEPVSGVQWRVPEVLLSGDHKKILKWRKEHSVRVKTKEYVS